MNTWLIIVIAVLALPVLIYSIVTFVSWFLYLPHAVNIFITPPQLAVPPGQPIEGGSEHLFRTQDGVLLSGTYLATRARQTRGLVIYSHGYRGNRWEATPFVEGLLDNGFDVFTFEYRGHGRSAADVRYRPLQWVTRFELLDLNAAIDFALQRCGGKVTQVGVIGSSRGANAALCLAAEDSRIRAVVADGAFSTDALQCHFMRRYMSIYSRLAFVWESLPNIGLFSYRIGPRLLAGRTHHCRYLNVEKIVRRVRQPVFMVQGKRDSFVPVPVAEKFRTLIGGRTKLWIVPRAKHNAAILVMTDEYRRRLERFFRRHLWIAERPVLEVNSPSPQQAGRQTAADVSLVLARQG